MNGVSATSRAWLLLGAFLIPPALLVVADFDKCPSDKYILLG
jgi:hypothetical protein